MKNPRQERIDLLTKPPKVSGEGRNMATVNYWQGHATENSKIAPHASDGPMRLPDTGVKTRPTTMRPIHSTKVDALMRGNDELNHKRGVGSMPGVRRTV
jgi:hypothetical protein